MQGSFIKSYPKSNYKNLLNGRGKLTAFLTLFLFISLLAEKTDFSNQESGDNNNIGNVFISPVIGRWSSAQWGILAIIAYMGRIPHKRVLFQVKLRVYESRVGISPVEAIDMVGNMSFWSVKRTKRYFFMAVKKSIKSSGFVIYSPLKDSVFIIAAVTRIQSSNLGMWKGYPKQVIFQ